MIQINELRIGNLVNWNSEIAKISQILEVEVAFKCGDIGFISDLNPIPLTEEWLLKFGFEVYAESIIMKAFKIGFNEITHDYLFDLCWIKSLDGKDKYAFYRNGRFEIKSVHQLQNLYFALVGEELTVK